jgi:hypothetical protein
MQQQKKDELVQGGAVAYHSYLHSHAPAYSILVASKLEVSTTQPQLHLPH